MTSILVATRVIVLGGALTTSSNPLSSESGGTHCNPSMSLLRKMSGFGTWTQDDSLTWWIVHTQWSVLGGCEWDGHLPCSWWIPKTQLWTRRKIKKKMSQYWENERRDSKQTLIYGDAFWIGDWIAVIQMIDLDWKETQSKSFFLSSHEPQKNTFNIRRPEASSSSVKSARIVIDSDAEKEKRKN